MSDSDFIHTPLSRLGVVMDWILGPSITTIAQGPTKTRTLTLRSEDRGDWPHIRISCTRVVYNTRYKRWWVAAINRTLYEVTVDVPEFLREKHGPEAFAPMTYPLLCNQWLQWTTYPHVRAILTYLDALLERLGGAMVTARSIQL